MLNPFMTHVFMSCGGNHSCGHDKLVVNHVIMTHMVLTDVMTHVIMTHAVMTKSIRGCIGPVPDTLPFIPMTQLILSQNEFNGTIHFALAMLNIFTVRLDHNMFTGDLPYFQAHDLQVCHRAHVG